MEVEEGPLELGSEEAPGTVPGAGRACSSTLRVVRVEPALKITVGGKGDEEGEHIKAVTCFLFPLSL